MEDKIMKYQSKSGEEISLSFELIRKYLVSGKGDLITPQEMMVFMGICKERGLNPFARDCYLIKYTPNDPAAIVTSADYFRSRARAQRDCQGWEKGIIVKTKEGQIKKTHGLILDGETLLGGWFRAQPEGWKQPFELEVNLGGYIKTTQQGAPTRFWQKENQPTMIAKVAESQGLRTLWPDEFKGLYGEEEAGKISHEVIDIKGVIEEQAAGSVEQFDELLNQKIPIQELEKKQALDAFLEQTANANGVSFDAVKVNASTQFEDFWGQFEKWFEAQKPKTAGRGRPKKEEPKLVPEPEIIDGTPPPSEDDKAQAEDDNAQGEGGRNYFPGG